jgi:hypothetical protein
MLGICATTMADNAKTTTTADYILAIERYDLKAWAFFDSVDRHEITTGTDRGAQLYAYRNEGGNIERVILDYALSQSDRLYCLLYRDGKLVKATTSARRYRSGKDGDLTFCQPYPQTETNRFYFRGTEILCLSSEDKACEGIRSDSAKQKAIFVGASDLLRELLAIKPEAQVPDVEFLEYL